MGRNIGHHADGNPRRTRHQQIGETCRQHNRFFKAFIVVQLEVDGVLIQVTHHLAAQPCQAGLRITVGRGRVTVTRTEVAVTVHQGVSHGEVLRHAHKRVIHTLVTVRVKTPQHVTDGRRALSMRLIPGESLGEHGIQYSSVHRF